MSIDTTDMHVIHRVFRMACSDAPRAFGGATGEDERAALGAFYECVLGFLHCHHAAEDALLVPLLAQRCPEQAALLARMHAEHESVTRALDRAESVLARWQRDPHRDAAELVAAIGTLGAELDAHIDEEERSVLPLAGDHVTLEEWGALPGYAMGKFQSDKKWLIMGLVRQQMTAEQLAHLKKVLPPAATEAWESTGKHAFAALMARMPRAGADGAAA